MWAAQTARKYGADTTVPARRMLDIQEQVADEEGLSLELVQTIYKSRPPGQPKKRT
jgi:hypothetical protein